MLDIIGFGALNVDLVYEIDDLSHILVGGRPCEAGGEMFCAAGEFDSVRASLEKHGRFVGRSAGGSAANTVVAMTRMGFSAGFIGRVGDDENGEFLLSEMVGVENGRVRRAGVTGMTVVLLDPDGERTIIVLPNSNDEITREDVDMDYVKSSRCIHMTSFAGEKPTEAQIKLAENLPEPVMMSFDPGEIHTQKGLVKMMPVFRASRVVFVTDREIRLLTGEDYIDGAHEILNYGPDIVVAKLGKIGSYVLTKESEIRVKSTEVKAVDKTGAGDVYAAGFIAGMLKDLPLGRSAEIADKAASRSVTGWGRSKYPDASILSEAG